MSDESTSRGDPPRHHPRVRRAVCRIGDGGLWAGRLKRFVEGTDLSLSERYQRYIAAFDDAEKTDVFSDDLRHELDQRGWSRTAPGMRGEYDDYDPLDRMLFTDMHTY